MTRPSSPPWSSSSTRSSPSSILTASSDCIADGHSPPAFSYGLLQSVAGIGGGPAVEDGGDDQCSDGQHGHEGEGEDPGADMNAVDEVLQPARGDDGRYGAGKRETDEDNGTVADIGLPEDGGYAGSEILRTAVSFLRYSVSKSTRPMTPHRARMAAMTLNATTRRDVRISFWYRLFCMVS